MNNYILTITVVSVITAFICIAAHERTQKHISFLASIIMIIVILTPLLKFDNEKQFEDLLTENPTYDVNTDTNHKASEYLSKSIYQTIRKQYDLEVSKIIIKTNTSSAFDVSEIEVYTPETIYDISKISEDLTKLYDCKIKIIKQ